MSDVTQLHGILEIDHKRGVIYFHCDELEKVEKFGVTALRICQLPKPIPERALDITHMMGADWSGERKCPICCGTGRVKQTSFVDPSKEIDRDCTECKATGTLDKIVLPHCEKCGGPRNKMMPSADPRCDSPFHM